MVWNNEYPSIFRLKCFKHVGTYIRMLEIAESFDDTPLTNCIINLCFRVLKHDPLYGAKCTHMGVAFFLLLAIPFLHSKLRKVWEFRIDSPNSRAPVDRSKYSQLARAPQNAKCAYRPEKGVRRDRWRTKVVVGSLRTRLGSGARHADQLIGIPAGSKQPVWKTWSSLSGPELNIKCSKSGGAKLKGLSHGKAKWRILKNERTRKRKSLAGDHGEKGGRSQNGAKSRDEFRGRKKIEDEKSRQWSLYR